MRYVFRVFHVRIRCLREVGGEEILPVRASCVASVGGISAAFVGGSMLACGLRAGGMLLAFFFSSSALTRLREDLKDVDDAFKAGGGRDYKQARPPALHELCARKSD